MPSPWLMRTLLTAAFALHWSLSPVAAEPAAAPKIVFNPEPGVTQVFKVKYRQRYIPDPPALPSDGLAVDYKLSVTPTRDKDGYRLTLLVSEVEKPEYDGMNMPVAAALMLDGLPFDMLVDSRGYMTEVADWPKLQLELLRRADGFRPEWQGVAQSVPGGHTAQQVAWHLARALDAMGFARSYIGFADRFGASTITWHGGTKVDVTIEPPDADGGMAVTWALPSGAGVPREGEGRGVIRRDGFVAPLTISTSRDGGRSPEVHEIELITGR